MGWWAMGGQPHSILATLLLPLTVQEACQAHSDPGMAIPWNWNLEHLVDLLHLPPAVLTGSTEGPRV